MTERNGRLSVFLDRDGVINRRRSDHVKSWDEFAFVPGSLQALASLHRLGARVVVITNQASVGRGLLADDELVRIHDRMGRAITDAGGRIERVYACTHTPEAGCLCRKPGTELFTRASTELGIELRQAFMIGDSESDIAAAKAVGSRPVLIMENRPNGHAPECAVARDLAEAVELIEQLVMVKGIAPC